MPHIALLYLKAGNDSRQLHEFVDRRPLCLERHHFHETLNLLLDDLGRALGGFGQWDGRRLSNNGGTAAATIGIPVMNPKSSNG